MPLLSTFDAVSSRLARLAFGLLLGTSLAISAPIAFAQQRPGGQSQQEGGQATGQGGGQGSGQGIGQASAQGGQERRGGGDGEAARPGQPDARKFPAEATTRHTLDIGGKSLAFTATLGSVPLFDGEGGPLLAEIGFVAFRLDGADPTTRPLTFAVNGGPGAASAYLNLGTMGPWRLPLPTLSPSDMPATVPNAESWLPFTDLVFLDPVGAGYSWTNKTGDEARRRFWSVDSDIATLAVSIRKWVEKENRQVSPKFLVGESYGGFRVPKLARALQGEQGVGIRGIVMVSPVLDFAWRFQNRHTPMRWVTELPSMAAALREGKSAAPSSGKSPGGREALADVEAYAAGEYMADLLKGPRDPAAMDRIVGKVAGFTGLDADLVRRLGGRINSGTFLRERYRGEQRIGSAYDAGVTGLDPDPAAAFSRNEDPILDAIDAPLSAAMTDLYRRLGWRIDRPYRLLNREVGNQWMWGNRRSAPNALDDLRTALALDGRMRSLVVHGATDLVTPYFESKLLLDQLPALGGPDRYELKVYPGGHMFYTRDEARAAFRDDAAKLYRAATEQVGP